MGSVATHLQTQHGAQSLGPWRLRFRPYRTVRGSHSEEHTKGLRAEQPADDLRRQRRVMWEVTDAAQPQAVFLLFEDAAMPTRAEMRATPSEGHSRWHAHVVSAEFATLLRHANLPGPLGTPAGTLGPGAWMQRGANIAFDGLSFRIRLGQAQASLLGTAPEQEVVLSIGNVIVGADRVVGGIVEIQYLPLTRLSPSSSLLGSLLVALLPPNLVPLLTPVPAPAHELILSSSVVPRTMLAPSQLEEVVPASTSEWRNASQARQAPQNPEAFPPWDDEPNYTPDVVGWTGVEPRRRMAFVYLTMLRAEGLA